MEHVLLLHGAIGAKDQLTPLAKELSSNFTIHTLSFSGHGGTAMPTNFNIETFAKDVLLYLEEQHISKISIFGYSMGGYVALYLAKNHPDKIGRIFTLATKFLWTPEIAEKEQKMLNPAKIEEKLPAFAKTLQGRHEPNDWKMVLTKTAEMMEQLGVKNTLALEDYSTIEHPITISIGDKDTMVTLEETIAVYRQLKNARLIVLPDTQHPIEKINLNRLTNEILEFMS